MSDRFKRVGVRLMQARRSSNQAGLVFPSSKSEEKAEPPQLEQLPKVLQPKVSHPKP